MDQNTKEENTGGREIDLIELVKKVWAARRFIIKWTVATTVVGLVVAFSIPAEYGVSVKMVAEDNTNTQASGGMSQLMNLAGFGTGTAGSGYGIGVMMYPEIVSTVPFLADMRNIKVQPRKADVPVTLYEYITKDQETAWWNYIISAPFKALGWVSSLFREKKEVARNDSFNIFALTPEQEHYINGMRARVNISLNKKTAIVSANVTMQDPVVTAVVADSMVAKLKEYIIRYRTDKARQDMEYCTRAFEESKNQYFNAQKRYAVFVDQNKNIVKESVKIEQDRLNNEMNLAFSVYNATAQQLETAKLKVQEQTPCVTVIEPASVPLRKSKPRKMNILFGFIFLGIVGSAGYVAGKELFFGQKSSSMPK